MNCPDIGPILSLDGVNAIHGESRPTVEIHTTIRLSLAKTGDQGVWYYHRKDEFGYVFTRIEASGQYREVTIPSKGFINLKKGDKVLIQSL